MAITSIEAPTHTGNVRSAHPSPPPADDFKATVPYVKIGTEPILGLERPKSYDVPLSPPSDYQPPASPAPTEADSLLRSPAEAPKDELDPLDLPIKDEQPAPQLAKMKAADAKICKNLLQNLKKHQAAWLFLEPVDPVVACAPDYYEVIKHPMDLSTVEKKLMAEEYEGPQQFVDDIQLMLNNCFVYNPPTNGVHISGKDLEAFFLRQLNKCFPAITTNSMSDASACDSRRVVKRQVKPPSIFEPEAIPVKKQKATPRRPSAVSSRTRTTAHSYGDDDVVERQMSTLASCLEEVNQQLAMLTGKKKRKRSLASSGTKPRKSKYIFDEDTPIRECEYCRATTTPMWRRGPSGCGTLCNRCGVKWRQGNLDWSLAGTDTAIASATSSKPKAQKATARGKSSRTSSLRTTVQSITEDQKCELSELITRVPDEHMDKVLNIIRSGLPQLDETEGEIELDVETIDAVTLVELYSFVKEVAASPSEGPRGLASDDGGDFDESGDED
ncbi:hypothetical protein HDU85_004315 [Gaertneriomyces sp. JEL0708]|nr:hypothetical protein HDU85_004315 [Gaertneriomyces sp. JEL0708]